MIPQPAKSPPPKSGFVGVQPFPGIPVRKPVVDPKPGQVIIRFDIIQPRTGCFECETLSVVGWVTSACLFVFCWPLMYVPCCVQECHDKVQVPIYGDPSELPPGYISSEPAKDSAPTWSGSQFQEPPKV